MIFDNPQPEGEAASLSFRELSEYFAKIGVGVDPLSLSWPAISNR